tara:strand:+ start:2693 stop:3880 length:1188 start_codon:yes stop_codon:yes gene_type:complete
MIVKDEASNLRRCFEPLLPYITTYVICDTGSTDGTPDLIKEYFDKHKIKGKILHHKWYNDFGKNRTMASKAAYNSADYVFTMDADDILYGDLDFSDMKKNTVYNVKLGTPANYYYRPLIWPGNIKVFWMCPVHEYMTWKEKDISKAFMPGEYCIMSFRNGQRNKEMSGADRLKRDSNILLKAIEEGNGPKERNYFYLANTYYDNAKWEDAIKYYKKRAESGGWAEEVFVSQIRMGHCYGNLGEGSKAVECFFMASQSCPARTVEAYFFIMRHYRHQKLFFPAVNIGLAALRVPSFLYKSRLEVPAHFRELFIDNFIRDWAFWDELSVSATYVNRFDIALACNEKILKSKHVLDNEQLERIEKNQEFVIKEKKKLESMKGYLPHPEPFVLDEENLF